MSEAAHRSEPVPADLTAADAADRAAAELEAGYLEYRERYRAITRRARQRFAAREWQHAQWDAAERLVLYKHVVDLTLERLRALPTPAGSRLAGAELKAAYASRIRGWTDAELAGTFYNSVVRRFFQVVGVDPAVEFLDPDREHGRDRSAAAILRSYACASVSAGLIARAVRDFGFAAPFRDLQGDSALAAAEIGRTLERTGATAGGSAVEFLTSVFYRSKGAYLVGRVRRGSEFVPLVLPLLHGPAGIEIDAVLLTADEASVVFGFTRSYFQVEVDRPRAMVEFLRSIMPQKRVDELYTAIGYHKHGKRELYAELQSHLGGDNVRFDFAPGKKGLVMIVFTLPSFNVVFKVIRDRFGPTKEATREGVMERYRLVFMHDRVGRLADAQEFEHLEVPAACFAADLRDELLEEAHETVELSDGTVILEHLYTERRVVPLDLFLRDAEPASARAAVLDYGHAIRDLAAANIFPGDMLLKNFGVTRHGRVIFYDYDELRLLMEVNFRRMPAPRDPYDEFAAEPWFHVAENDVFPEELLPFLLPEGPLREVFLAAHAELLDVAFWRRMQERQREGELIDFFPYPATRRLHGS